VTRFWQICNNILDFKHAVTQLSLRLLLRGHPTPILMRGWNKFVHRHPRRSSLVNVRLSEWFRRMISWALQHPLQDPACTHGVPQPQTHVTPASEHMPAEDTPTVPPKQTCRKRSRDASTASPPHPSKKPRTRDDTMLCGMYAVNTCLRAYSVALFTVDTLKQICVDIDNEERAMFTNDRDRRAFIRANGTNRTNQGFLLQSLQRALHSRNVQHITFDNIDVFTPPPACRAFLLHTPHPAPIGHFLAVTLDHTVWHLWDNDRLVTTASTWQDCIKSVTITPPIVCTFT